jgi:DEAD/DEAH box helicase domain-containing protein
VEGIAGFLEAVGRQPALRGGLRHHEIQESRPPAWRALEIPELEPLRPVLERRGIRQLYGHQARALELVSAGRDVVLATPTASGKTLVYALPALAHALRDPEARALFLFPLRALEQDQRARLEEDIAALPRGFDLPTVAVYDGDTPAAERRRLRERPPSVLITTPDMLHLGILPGHESWRRFFAGLRLVVVDELHTYRGVFGSHVAQVLRRVDRVCARHGARPGLVTASATVANPGELASRLTGREVEVVRTDGAPRPRRHVLLLNPAGSPYTAAAQLFRLAVGLGLRTIAFTKARTVTELIYTWVVEAEPRLRGRVSSYRAGFLPEERREIERRLFDGELSGVIATSALEMGIDVGGLDVCILVGYPGSQIATWQRAGRVGRRREAAVVLVAQPDALDQYLMSHPRVLFERAVEHAVVDPHNPEIAAAHLACAAAESPLRPGEPWLAEAPVRALVDDLESRGLLLRSEDGDAWFSARRRPHRDVDLRTAGASWAVVEEGEGGGAPRTVGTVGSGRVFAECHEGAIYLHRGRQYLITRLDLEERVASARPVKAPFYTRALSEKETEILSRERTRPAGNFRLVQGRVKVTTRITGFERRRVLGQDLLGTERLELPPSCFETTSLWLEMPAEIPAALREDDRHPMGSIHAVEHATLALVPLFSLCDRSDVAGISHTRHPQTNGAAIFLYDSHAGGVGLVASLFERVEGLLESTLELIRDCPCEEGCPACVHSPRCGAGNRPLDKAGARQVLELLLGRRALPVLDESAPPAEARALAPAAAEPAETAPHLVFFDLETQRSAEEVGGWHNAHLMRLALAVAWDSRSGGFRSFHEEDVGDLLELLATADLVVGFNVRRFDYRVLQGYTDRDLGALCTFDLLDAIHARLGFRLSLGHLGEETLGESKSGDGLQSLRWWREGRVAEVEEYCRRDVALLRGLFEHALAHGHLLFRTRGGERVRLPMRIQVSELLENGRARRQEGTTRRATATARRIAP